MLVEENIKKCVTVLNEKFKNYLESQALSTAIKESYKQPQIREFQKNYFYEFSIFLIFLNLHYICHIH